MKNAKTRPYTARVTRHSSSLNQLFEVGRARNLAIERQSWCDHHAAAHNLVQLGHFLDIVVKSEIFCGLPGVFRELFTYGTTGAGISTRTTEMPLVTHHLAV